MAVDGRTVEYVVAEWATRHDQPFRLDLSGPAGGRFRHGNGRSHLEVDAIEFCRTLSGRAPALPRLLWGLRERGVDHDSGKAGQKHVPRRPAMT